VNNIIISYRLINQSLFWLNLPDLYKMKNFYIISLAMLFVLKLQAQVSVKDSAVFSPIIYATYSYQIPGGDMAKRFGNNSAIGGGFEIKTKKNWLFGVEGNYLFAEKVKNEESILSGISTSDGYQITVDGEYADVFFREQGYILSLKAGKIIPVLNPNPNCGIMVTLQPGFIQHKIKIVNSGNTVPQLHGDYKKGYDEMSSGFSITEFLGYMYMGNKRLVSFYAGFEFTQAFTKCRREYNFNTMSRDTKQKYDYFYGIRIGWLIPLYKRAPAGYYF